MESPRERPLSGSRGGEQRRQTLDPAAEPDDAGAIAPLHQAAREIQADGDSSAADALIARLAKCPPEPGKKPKRPDGAPD